MSRLKSRLVTGPKLTFCLAPKSHQYLQGILQIIHMNTICIIQLLRSNKGETTRFLYSGGERKQNNQSDKCLLRFIYNITKKFLSTIENQF